MLSVDHFADQINEAISDIKYPDSPAGLYEPIHYTLEGGGKRLRPVLLLACCHFVGGKSEDAVNQALGIELFHNFTLLHDDVMDRADIRRGRPTVHRRWNDSTAILSGDAMLTMATSFVVAGAGSKIGQIIGLFNKTAMEIYEGQQFDMDFENRRDVSVGDYIEMIRLKTSVLIGCACKMGAVMGGATEETQQALYDYGINLGLAFQLRDDYLDTYGDPLTFGKEIGGDIVNNKKTWLLINAMNSDMSEKLKKVINQSPTRGDKIEGVKSIYAELGLPGKCRELISKYVADAIEVINEADLNESGKRFLTEIALSTIERDN